jgi:putative phosphoribosyl transferase
MYGDRVDAGRRLGEALEALASADLVVLGIPRGGVVVAAEVARLLGSPLDVVVTRKIGSPSDHELAIGAIAPGVEVWDTDLIDRLGVTPEQMRRAVEIEDAEIVRRAAAYRGDLPTLDLRGRTVLLVDDGLATGATALASVRWARSVGASRVLVAVPVGARETARRLGAEADEVHSLLTPVSFRAVGEWYMDFDQTTDDEVVAALARAREAAP